MEKFLRALVSIGEGGRERVHTVGRGSLNILDHAMIDEVMFCDL
jgi:hypothetical protein